TATGTASIDTRGGVVTDQGFFTVEGTMTVSKRSVVVVEGDGQLNTQNPGLLDIQGTLLTWNNPGNITHGTALSATQLNATANVSGTFSYTLADGVTNADGAILGAGLGQ